MQTNIYSVYDKKALTYAHLFQFPTTGLATRAFSDLCADTRTQINKHPSDYTLYKMGEFDDQTGRIKPLTPPEHIAEALEFVKPVIAENVQNG